LQLIRKFLYFSKIAMKKIALSICVFSTLISLELKSQFIISNDTSLPDSSSYVEVKSNNRGWLIPRMTTQQRNNIHSPAAGLMIYNTDSQSIEFFNSSHWVNINAAASNDLECGTYSISFQGLTYGTVPYDGHCWLDRNLGAVKVADSVNDPLSYGYYYQWGRGTDGHQYPTSDTTWTLATNPNPGHGDFILSQTAPKDWLTPQDPTLWNDASDYLNNPCPPGWKVPEVNDWLNISSDLGSIIDGFNSPLKLPATGMRTGFFGNVGSQGISGMYWTSRPAYTNSFVMYIDWISLYGSFTRTNGAPVRCIRSQQEATTSFTRLYGGINKDCGYNICRDGEGNLLILGFTHSFEAQNTDYMLVKVDEEGMLQWGKTFGFYYFDTGHCVLPAFNGGYILNGTAGWGSTYGDQMYVVKIDADGNIEWDHGYGSTGNEKGYDVIQDADSGFVFLGSTNSFGSGGWDFYFRKADQAGNFVYSYSYGTIYDDIGYALIKDTDGGYAILGNRCCEGGLGGKDMKFMKLAPDLSIGYSYLLGGTAEDGGTDLVLSHDSGYVMAGYTYSYGAGSSDFYVRKIDHAGNISWGYTYGGSGMDAAKSILRTSDDGFAVLGYTKSFGQGQTDMWLLKIDSGGQFEWSFAFGFIGEETGMSITQDESGYLYAAGYTGYTSYLYGQPDFLLVQFPPDGNACIGEFIVPGADNPLTGQGFHSQNVPQDIVFICKVIDDIRPDSDQALKIGMDQPDAQRATYSTITPVVTTICE
jgi:hypothetical protein